MNGHQVHGKVFTSLVIWETQIKMTTNHHLTPVRMSLIKRQEKTRGAWVFSRVKLPTLGFHSGHDLMIFKICADSTEPAWDSLSAPPPLCSLSLSQNK